MKQLNGLTVNCFFHLETQDGKSLLDAHFAHAAALIVRYLKRIRDNQLNKVTSPFELVYALSDLGGLKYCGVQLVSFDDNVDEKLAIVQQQYSKALEAMKD